MSNTLVAAATGGDISPRTDTTNVIKCGHLKKQGGARGGRKNWKRRWFILKCDYICYFQEKDGKSTDGPCLGVLPLRNAKVISVEYVPDDSSSPSAQTSPAASQPTTNLVLTCYMCQKNLTKKVVCKSCQNAFCPNCASELQMGDKTSRVCSKCRCHQADDEPVKDKGSALEMGVIVEVTQPEPKASKFFKKERPLHLFAIKTKERELWLAAEDAQEKAAWIQAIAGLIMSFKKSATGSSDSPMGSKEESEMPATPQSEIDYEEITILEKIGDGAFGEVFKGRLWGTDVAVKTIKPDQATEGVVEDLKKEVAILSQLRHPNVVLYIGACTKPPNVCIITEWCDRGSLHDVLHDSNIPLDIQRIVSLAVGIAQGMNYLHNLERRIIHRDLKSHNVVVDRNFNVKVADFGLSHVRESLTQRNPASAQGTQTFKFGQQHQTIDPDIGPDDEKSMKVTSESMGGHYGVFGTPEWMAPEIMEGTAYNQKVDVYSFGIMMSELLTRKLPFRDQYKIKSYLDVVDAVLDDGAMPTLPPWIGLRLKRVIELCLSRNANSRPSFTSIITKLRAIFSSSPADLFIAFDIPRITHMLSSTDRHNQALAAKEISLFKFDHEFLGDGERRVCARCKYSAAQHRPLDDATVTSFIAKLTDMLASSSAKVVLPAVEALERLIVIGRQRPESNLRTENLRTVCEKNGVERLIGLVASKSERLSQLASRAIMLLVDDLPVDDMSYRALKPTSLNVLSSLMIKEIVNLRESSHKLNEMLQEKKETVSALKVCLASVQAKKDAAELHDTPSSSLADIDPSSTPIVPAKTQQSDPAPSQPPTVEHSVPESTQAVAISHVEIAVQPKPALASANSSDQALGANSNQSILNLVDSRLQNFQTSESEDPDNATATNSASSAASIVCPPTPEIPIPKTHPASALDPELVLADWVLVHDPQSETWRPKYVVVQPSLIFIYSSYESMLQSNGVSPESIVNASVPAGRKLKYKTGRKYKQPYCFHLCCQGLKWWFALRSDKDTVLWGKILVLPIPEIIEETIRRYKPPTQLDSIIESVDPANLLPSPPLSSKEALILDSDAPSPLSVAIDEISASFQPPHDIIETPAPRAGFNSEQLDQLISVSPPADAKPDKKVSKDPVSDAEEPDKSQSELQLDLLGVKSPDIDENSSDATSENDFKDRSINAVNIVQQLEQSMPAANQYVAITPAIEDNTHQVGPVHLDDFSSGKDFVDDVQLHSIADFQTPITPLALFAENGHAPLTVRNRDDFHLESHSSDTTIEHIIPLNENHEHLDKQVDSLSGNADVVIVDEAIDASSSLTWISVSGNSLEAFAETSSEAVQAGDLPNSHIKSFDDHVNAIKPNNGASENDISTKIDINSVSNIDASIVNDTTVVDMVPIDTLSNSRAIDQDYVLVSNSDVTATYEDIPTHTNAQANNSASEVSATDPPHVGRFVKRYIDIAAPSTADAKVNICLTIKSCDDLIRSDKTLQMKTMPSVPSLPAMFAMEYGRRNCWQFTYLVLANVKTMKWESRFVILLGSHPRRLLLFKSHESLELADEFVLEGLARVADEHVVEKCLGFPVNMDVRLAFAVPVRSALDEHHCDLLCICSSEVEKNKWMSLLERVVLVSRTAT